MRIQTIAVLCLLAAACSGRDAPKGPPSTAQSVLLITIDTLRADRVGAYGYAPARTPALDGLARTGVRFDRAYATAPITLTSHASLLTGRYPPGHGARHNGMRIDLRTPTLAEHFATDGFSTAAFVAAFPLDRRFGLIKGFQTYGDRMPRGADGRLLNERPGRLVVDEALSWLSNHRNGRFFLWVHLFEPHAPYGNPDDPAESARPASARYDDDVAEADRQIGRLLDGLGAARATTLIAAVADHGEAFGEHGEIGHSVFTYDTTLRVPLIVSGPGVPSAKTVGDPVSLIDVAPTLLKRTGQSGMDGDGIDLSPALAGNKLPGRALYAESFAPLLDFGWSPLRTIRMDGWKYIAAPHRELYDLGEDAGETHNLVDRNAERAAVLAARTDTISGATLARNRNATDPEARARLQALGYLSGRPDPGADRPDPKDRRELAGRIAQVTSGEVRGTALEHTLRAILRDDPGNPQMNLRLGYILLDAGRCTDAVPHFQSAIAGHLAGAEAHLGLAACQTAARTIDAAEHTLRAAETVEPDNPLVAANLGILLSDGGHPADAVPHLQRALTLDPDLHQARFALAIAYARQGRRGEAAAEASTLLERLPPGAPQRPEVQRLLAAVR